ncbi:collagen-like protein [Pseudomonas sp. NPDC089392]|uniref:collagen-like protein n=1 Tax=Pseudomonas sp. NPDC089392 TaxID=3364459 RepID=UPI0037FFCF6F
MRNLMLLAMLAAPLAQAESLEVASNSMVRLPDSSASVHLTHLRVADAATLMLPATLAELKVDQLELGRDARIAVAPSDKPLLIEARSVRLAEGSEFSATGAAGSYQRAARSGRSLDLKLVEVDAERVAIDARGGAGAPGYVGLDGANGQAGGCAWGQASRGANGDDGGNGHDGAPGGRIRLSLPQGFPHERIVVRLDGGAPGKAGAAGKAGKGGASKGCLVYRTDAGANGQPGQPGQPGLAGAAGELILQRL